MQSDRTDVERGFKMVSRPMQNAFCVPSDRVAIDEGILPVCQDEAGLAVVISHEVAHASARPGVKRMGQSQAIPQTEQAIIFMA